MADGVPNVLNAQRTAWAGLSASWERWDAIIVDQLAPVGAGMIDRLSLGEAQRYLDVASGTGEPGLSIARRCPAGRVVLTDLSAPMLAVATRRAVAQRIANVDTVVCSADRLPFGDAAFDGVSVRFGYMFFPDLAAATAEFVRVLRPGGRLCASVWVDPSRNPWTSIAMAAVATEVTLPPPLPDAPSMYRCARPGLVQRLFEEAGLQDVAEWDVEVELVTRSPEQYWQMLSDHVSLVAAALRGLDDAARDRVGAHAVAAVRACERDGAVRVPGLARCVVGTAPRRP